MTITHLSASLVLLLTDMNGIGIGTIIKIYHDMTDYADAIHVEQFASQITGFDSSNGVVLVVFVLALALSILVAFSIYAARDNEMHPPQLRLIETGDPPSLHLKQGHRWMLFLSHVWSTGQECAIKIRILRTVV